MTENDYIDTIIQENQESPFFGDEQPAIPKAGSFSVAVYLVDRAYGGNEEGGWWYDCGELVRIVQTFRRKQRAYEYVRRLNRRLRSRRFGPNAGRREISSVLSEGEYQAQVCEGAVASSFPERRPYYE
jgi:hypothetical protein